MIGWSLGERYIGIENTVNHRKELGVVSIAEGDIRVGGPLRLPNPSDSPERGEIGRVGKVTNFRLVQHN